jgi:hypothetical protein
MGIETWLTWTDRETIPANALDWIAFALPSKPWKQQGQVEPALIDLRKSSNPSHTHKSWISAILF